MFEINHLLSAKDKRLLLEGMLLTRATDNALKKLFLSGTMIYKNQSFQGKGFRSLGQEAIFGAGYLLNRGESFQSPQGYTGDIIAPLIRDLGLFLCFSDGDVETALNAQAAKSGPPSQGRDLHYGDFSKGILMPAAPLAIASCTLIGLALSFKLKQQARVALSFIGEGGSSLGEWHEAINFAAVKKLPMVFCIENNQTALSTPISQQCRAKNFADKAIGYGIKSMIIDGNNVEEMAAGFKYAADYARSEHEPILIEVITMRMCGHAHHDDMLYLGHDPELSFVIPEIKKSGYVDYDLYEKWRIKDPIVNYKNKLLYDKIIDTNWLQETEQAVTNRVAVAVSAIKARPWPELKLDDAMVYSMPYDFSQPKLEPDANYLFDPEGINYLQAIAQASLKAIKEYPCYIIGEDVGQPYGNAFMMYKNIPEQYHDKFINTPISENAIVGACVGMALAGLRPIGEIQFNDFLACAINQVANNAAKHYFRTGLALAMVLRLPYGGLRRAGPFHSQDTSAWFYRCSGLKIFAPSTPHDAYFMLLKAAADPDPVLFYEHIALYRDPKIKQIIPELSWDITGASIVRPGHQLTMISYGAFVHRAVRVAEILQAEHNLSVEVIDLRYLMPLDFATCYSSIKKTSRVLLVNEDTASGSILQSLAASISQELFSYLDAPVTVLGARNIPVPYAPSLEDAYLLSEDEMITRAIALINY